MQVHTGAGFLLFYCSESVVPKHIYVIFLLLEEKKKKELFTYFISTACS